MSYFHVTVPFPGVFHIKDPFGVAATLLVGERKALLIDTTLGFGDLPSEIRRITTLPLIVVNTHGHNDHIAGDYQFREAYLDPSDFPVAEIALSKRIKDRVLNLYFPKNPPKGFSLSAYMASNTAFFKPLQTNVVFDLGGLTVEPVKLPTHTRGSTGFLIKEQELLITGDAIAPFMYLFFPESSNTKEYLSELIKVEALSFRWMLCAHSERLIPKSELNLYKICVHMLDPMASRNYKDPIFPEYPARMFIHTDRTTGDSAILIYDPEKL